MQRKEINPRPKGNITSKTEETISTFAQPRRQRALILQGGAALGAYEAGVYKELYEWIIEKDSHASNNNGRNVFDIIAGASAGAINAALLVDHVRKKKAGKSNRGLNTSQNQENWEGSVKLLEDFWIDISTKTFSDYSHQFLEFIRTQTPFGAPFSFVEPVAESFRRYYSVKQLQSFGARNMFWPIGMFGFPSPVLSPLPDFKFYSFVYLPFPYNLSSNVWFRFSNQPLRETMRKYWDGDGDPLKTNYDDDEPRLLVVSIDVKEGETVTFDSYADLADECKICGREFKASNNKPKGKSNKELIKHVYEDHRIQYNDHVQPEEKNPPSELRWSVYGGNKKSYAIPYASGLELKHVVACASVPIIFDYEKIETFEFKFENSDTQGIDGKHEITSTDKEKSIIGRKATHFFWDGQYLSNTPLREVIGAHTTFWKDRIGRNKLADMILLPANDKGHEQKEGQDMEAVPDLDVYIVNLWPSKEENIPSDHDGEADRKNDIMFHDKSEYDEKVATFTTDYIDLTKRLIDLAVTNGTPKNKIEEILKDNAHSRFRTGKRRTYRDLLVGRFGVKKVIRIERTDDPAGISEKWGDYSYGTISKLFEQGRKDTLKTLIEEELIKVIDENIYTMNDQQKNDMKYNLTKPLRKAINEITKTGNVSDHIANVHDMITIDFIREIQKYRSLLDEIFRKILDDGTSRKNLSDDIQTSEDLPTYLTRIANFIGARLNPAIWQDENLDKGKQYHQELGLQQTITSSNV